MSLFVLTMYVFCDSKEQIVGYMQSSTNIKEINNFLGYHTVVQ